MIKTSLRSWFACAFLFSLSAFAQEAKPTLVTGAKRQIGVTISYDPSYVVLDYPGGDVPKTTGVCTDVVVRAFRAIGIDLQKEVHEDMRSNFASYPQNWGLTRADKNIDHRRVPNLMCYFKRQGYLLGDDAEFQPGDVVAWRLVGGLLHIGIVSDGKAAEGRLKAIHNIGSGAKEEDVLEEFEVIGHYRIPSKID